MKIDLTNVITSINATLEKEVSIELATFSSCLGEFPIHKKSPVLLHISNVENRQLLISGTVEMEVGLACDRCLEEVPTSLHFDINKELTLQDGSAVDEEMEETDYLIGFDLDVDKLVYAEILVNWPMKVLCKDDCEGICKVCGMNLNKGACDCQRTELDPRMAAIQDIFSKFKEV